MTPINYLANRINDNNFERVFLFHIQRLVDRLANVNVPDDDGITPIWRIIINENLSELNKRKMLTYLFENAVNVDIDSYHNGAIRKQLQNNFPDIKLPSVNMKRSQEEWDFNRLGRCLSSKQEVEFLEGLNSIVEWNGVDLDKLFLMDNGKFTLLKSAVRNGLTRAVERMLRLGADINFNGKDGVAPIEWACIHGYWKILEIFLRSAKINTYTDESLIWTVIPPLVVDDGAGADGEKNYEKCFQLLMESPKVDVDYVNSSNQTALDTAIRLLSGRPDIISALLTKGAYIGIDTKITFESYNKYPISNIDPKILENHFDDCITPFYEVNEPEYFKIRFDFRNLAATSYKQNKGLSGSDIFANEMEPINCIAQSKGLGHLLQHPLVQAFLFLKWQRLALIFNINLFVYFVFTASVLTYILSTYIYTNVPATTNFSWWISLAMTCVMILRELFQLMLSPHLYWRSLQNYLEISLLAMITFVLCDFDIAESQRRTIATVTILLVTSELFILLGSLEMFFIHFTMLKSVLISFLKAFALYMVILVAFALCFFAMLNHSNDTQPTTDQNKTGAEEKEDLSSFNNLGLSLVKILVMSIGEFDAGDINFSANPFSYLLFLVFLFLVSAVLFNLLSGLAVTNIQVITISN